MPCTTDLLIDGLVSLGQSMASEVYRQTRGVMLDFIGVLSGGMKYLEEKHPDLLEVAISSSFLNGFATHVLVLDDGHRHGNDSFRCITNDADLSHR